MGTIFLFLQKSATFFSFFMFFLFPARIFAEKLLMLINIFSAKCIGIDAVPVTVEVDMTAGIGIHLVGLADVAVKESLLRTVTALQSLGFRIPGKKIVINLAPADLHKKGSGYDLPIAIGIIAASGQKNLPWTGSYIIMGELGLDGSVRPVPGALPITEMARDRGFEGCILPYESACETAGYGLTKVFGVKTLLDVIKILEEGSESGFPDITETAADPDTERRNTAASLCRHTDDIPDFSGIYGQEGAKRGLEIAAAGGHNVLMIGPPGSGKSTLAKAMAGILPPMSAEESLQTSKIYSVAGRSFSDSMPLTGRPFRAPYHNTSTASLLGGGSESIIPGEISLAHNGVLFLDEFCEIPRRVLESLRGPLEDRSVTISRLRHKISYPASFMLVAATNPCPCGYYGDRDRCTCTPSQRASYLSRLSGPVMDRIDIHLWISPVDTGKLIDMPSSEPSRVVAERVAAARAVQKERFRGTGIFTNAEMTGSMTTEYCRLPEECSRFMKLTVEKMGLSARACHRILKLSRTIADMDGSAEIRLQHLTEASAYRLLDRRDPGMI